MLDPKKLQALLACFPHLQGLRVVPLGVMFLLTASARVGALDWLGETPGFRANLWFVGFYSALVGAVLIGRYYEARIGSATFREPGVPVLAIALPMFAGLLWLHRQILHEVVPVPLHVVFVGLALLRIGLAPAGLRVHYVPIAFAWLGLAALEPLGVPIGVRRLAADLTMAMTLIAGGLGDHVVLTREIERARTV